MKITIVFTNDGWDSEHVDVNPNWTLEKVREWVLGNYYCVSYIAF